MKQLIKKVVAWYATSNRGKHAKAGGIIFACMTILGLFCGTAIIGSIVIATASVWIAMASVEYKDKLCGNKFDWLDIVAGMTVPVVIDIVLLFIYLLV